MFRKIIKENAKAALRLRYWPYVGVTLLVGLLTGSGFSTGFNFSINSGDLREQLQSVPKEVWMGIMIAVMIAGALALGYAIFAGNVFQIGGARIFLDGYRGRNWSFSDLVCGFKNGRYWRNVGAMALMTLFILLGFLCFVIPGIILSYCFAQVPYILAEDDSISAMGALRRSWNLMDGKKADLFVFGLSFLGWQILNVLTLGVLGIFYVNPYMELATAGYYDALVSMEPEVRPVGNEGI